MICPTLNYKLIEDALFGHTIFITKIKLQMKKAIIFVLLACLSTTKGKAQYWDKAFTSDLLILDEFVKRSEKGISFDDPLSYQGTPYNSPSYLPGNVYKDDKLLATNVGLRYNAIADEIEIKETLGTPDEEAKVLTKSEDVYVKIADNIFVFVPYQGGIENGGYFQVLFEGNQIQLYKKLEKKFTAAKKAKSTMLQDTPAKFTDKPEYYIVTRTGKFYVLPKSKNKKLKVFGSNKDMIKAYINENRLDLNDEKDLRGVIKYYDTVGSVSPQ
jgi:hypothetical protein